MSDLDYSTEAEQESQGRDARAAENERLERAHDVAWVMSTERGRAFLWSVLEYAGLLQSSFTPGQGDVTAFREGRRAVGLAILARVEDEAPGALSIMRREYLARQKRAHVSPPHPKETLL